MLATPCISNTVLSPVDLAGRKISRLAGYDREDIASLVRLGLTSAEEIDARANESIAGYIGGQAMLMANLRDVIKLAHNIEQREGAQCYADSPSP